MFHFSLIIHLFNKGVNSKTVNTENCFNCRHLQQRRHTIEQLITITHTRIDTRRVFEAEGRGRTYSSKELSIKVENKPRRGWAAAERCREGGGARLAGAKCTRCILRRCSPVPEPRHPDVIVRHTITMSHDAWYARHSWLKSNSAHASHALQSRPP